MGAIGLMEVRVNNPFSAGVSTDRNLPLADQLAEVRSSIKLLKVREQEIVAQVVERGGESGAFVNAVVATSERRSLDNKLVRDELGARITEFEKVTSVTSVRLEDRDD